MADITVGNPYRADRAYAALIKRNISWVYAMVDCNANSCTDQCLRLYAKKPTSISKSRFPSKAVSDSRYKYLSKQSHLQKFVCAQGDMEEITDHPFLDAIQRAGGHYTGYDLSYLLYSSLDTTGNAYWHKERDPTGTIKDFWPLLPQLVVPFPDKKNFLSHYEYGLNNQRIKISRANMVHYKYASLKHPFLGSGPLEAGAEAADLSQAMNEYEVAKFRNGGTPDVVLSYPQGVQVNAPEQKRMKRDYRRNFTQPHNSGKLVITTEGAEFKPYSMSMKEMSYLKGREWSLKELSGIFGVPLSFFVLDGILKANIEASTQLYMRKTIKPKLRSVESVMNEQVIPEYDENLFVAYDNPIPEDVEKRLKEIEVKTSTKYASINELRAEDGLDPVSWGDEPVQPEPIVIDTEKRKKKVKQKFPPLQMPAANFLPEEFISEMVSFFKRQGQVILGQAEDAEFKEAPLDSNQMKQFLEDKELFIDSGKLDIQLKIAEDIVGPWFDMGLWDEQLKETIRPFVRASIISAGTKAAASLAPDRFFDPQDPRLFRAVESRIPSIRGINRTTLTLVRNTVADGIAGGLSGSKIQKSLRIIFEDVEGVEKSIARKRAVLIARTETIWAFNEGAVIAYKQSGVVNSVEWLTAEDERVCQWCDPMDGRTQTLGQNFFQMGDEFEGRDGGTLRFNAEPIEHPPLHPQCRCSLAPIV